VVIFEVVLASVEDESFSPSVSAGEMDEEEEVTPNEVRKSDEASDVSELTFSGNDSVTALLGSISTTVVSD
jgi:hypothetical protein